MLIENFDALKKYLVESLGSICDADPKALSKYIIALLKKPRTEADLKMFFLDQLEIFLMKNTETFVDQLFEAIKTKSYLLSTTKKCLPKPENIESFDKNAKSFGNVIGANAFEKSKHSIKDNQSPNSQASSLENKSLSREKVLLPVHEMVKEEPSSVLNKDAKYSMALYSNLQSVPADSSQRLIHGQRCKDYDERGYCLLGDSCSFYHGSDPVIVEDVSAINIGMKYIPEPYNPQNPSMKLQRADRTSVNYHNASLSKHYQVPSVIPTMPPHQSSMQNANVKSVLKRELTSVQIVDCESEKKNNLQSHMYRKRRNVFDNNKLGPQCKKIQSKSPTETSELKPSPQKDRSYTDQHLFSFEKAVSKSYSDIQDFPSLSKTVFFNPKTSVSSAPSVENDSEERKKLSVSFWDLYQKKLELTKKEIQHQKLILERLKTTKDANERDILKKISEDLASKIKASQTELEQFLQKEKLVSKSQKTMIVENKKKILDTEMDLYKALNKGPDIETTALLKKVSELKEKVQAIGLLDSASGNAELKIKSTKQPSHGYCPKSGRNMKLLKTDNRAKALLISGVEDSKRDTLVDFLLKFPGVQKTEPVSCGFIALFSSRKAAEMMLQKLKKFTLGDENMSVSWYHDDLPSTSEDMKPVEEKNDDLHYVDYDEDMDEDDACVESKSRSWRW